MSGNAKSGTEDLTYDLVSVIYHALQGVETSDVYTRDAEKAGDQELAKFFQNVKDQYQSTAEQAKKMLAKNLS
jgi:hypothetical protein